MNQSYPNRLDFARDENAENQVEWLKDVITGIRNIRGEANIKPSQEIGVLLQGGSVDDRNLASSNAAMLRRLANVNTIEWLADNVDPPPHALSLVGDLRMMVPLAGLIDISAEKARIEKDIEKAESELKRVVGKLSNEKFTAKAPAEVVAKEREKEAALQTRIRALREQIAKLAELV